MMKNVLKELTYLSWKYFTFQANANPLGEVKPSSDLFFVKQTISNACGTVAIVHSLANNQDKIKFIGKANLYNW